jgi:hypothetical protein
MTAALFAGMRGVSLGTGTTELKRIEDSVRAGRNAVLTALTQTAQVSYTFSLTNEAIPDIVPAGAKIVTYLAPSLLAYAVKKGFMRPVCLFLQDHIGTLCQLASTISAIALIALGSLALGIASLSLLALGYLDRWGILPLCLRQFIHDTSPIIRIATGIIVGDLLEKLFALATVVFYCYEKCIAPPEEPAPPPQIDRQNALTPELLDRILKNNVPLEINSAHLRWDILVPTPNIEIRELLSLYDTVDWEPHLQVIRAKCKGDARFVERIGDPEKMDPPILIAHMRENLKSYLNSVQGRHIADGEIHDYDRLEIYLKVIADYLKKEQNAIHRADALLRLSVEGGQYCGPEKFHVAEDLYANYILRQDQVPVHIQILLSLQDSRTQWMQARYLDVMNGVQDNPTCMTSCLSAISAIDFQDLHFYNQFINIYGSEFGLRRGAAANDHAAVIDPLSKAFLRKLIRQFKILFESEYTPSRIQQILQDKIGTPGLPLPNLFTWWQNWIDRQNLSQQQKTILSEELQNENQLLGSPLLRGRSFDRRFTNAMLLDLGILRLPP